MWIVNDCMCFAMLDGMKSLQVVLIWHFNTYLLLTQVLLHFGHSTEKYILRSKCQDLFILKFMTSDVYWISNIYLTLAAWELVSCPDPTPKRGKGSGTIRAVQESCFADSTVQDLGLPIRLQVCVQTCDLHWPPLLVYMCYAMQFTVLNIVVWITCLTSFTSHYSVSIRRKLVCDTV